MKRHKYRGVGLLAGIVDRGVVSLLIKFSSLSANYHGINYTDITFGLHA